MILDSEQFLNPDWGLENETAKALYDGVVVPLRTDKEKGIIDAHTHFSAQQILENEASQDITTAMIIDFDERWRNRDHYIIQSAAGQGVPFEFWYDQSIPTKDKWKKFAEIFPNLVGTQVHLWTELELNKTLGIEGRLSSDTADDIWGKANAKLQTDNYRPHGLLKKANVKVLCTTDDPLDGLEYHIQAKKDMNWIQILPTFRPDKAMNIFAEGWGEYVTELCEKAGEKPTFDGFIDALQNRHDFFGKHGCRASDHGIEVPYGLDVNRTEANSIFNRVYTGNHMGEQDKYFKRFASFLMQKFCEMDKEKDWVTQIHFGAKRNVNGKLYKLAGADAGGDVSTRDIEIIDNLSPLLSKYCATGDRSKDAKVVLYSLSPNHYSEIAQLTRVFPGVSYGMAWWFNDSFQGMTDQLKEMYSVSPLSRGAGMVCDGRKLLSVEQRHDVYARAVCNLVGGLVKKGIVPGGLAPGMIEGLCYTQQKQLFNF